MSNTIISLLMLVITFTACATGRTEPTHLSPTPSATTQTPFVFVDEAMILRNGPGVAFDVIAQASPGRKYPVLGRHTDWWLVDIGDGASAWLYAPVFITNFVGDQDIVAQAPSPPTPTPKPTPACRANPPRPPPEQVIVASAQFALTKFFTFLNHGQYAEAAELYSGDYESLRDSNPLVDPEDLPTLLKHACEINGYQCLLPARVAPLEAPSSGHYAFTVEFLDPSGATFVRGPCCGASEQDMPPQSQFPFEVLRSCDGRHSVTDLPPYVP